MKRTILHSFIQLLTLIFIFFLVRMLEYTWVCTKGVTSFSLDLFFSKSVNLDSIFLFFWVAFFLLISLISSLVKKKLAGPIQRGASFLIVVLHLLFTLYFLASNNVLNASVFEFSFKELIDIIGYEFSFTNLFLLIVAIVVGILSYYLIYKVAPRLKVNKRTESILLGVFLIVAVFAFINRNHLTKEIKYFDSNYDFLIGNSKETLFASSIIGGKKKNDFNLYRAIDQTRNYQKNNLQFDFADDQFPLIHKEAYQNVLGPYFAKDRSVKPNIVVIVCESLSNNYSGNDVEIPKSLTYWIDSLSQHSLYWSNFHSNAERSFGAVPNILSSLPSGTGQRGFVNMGLALPSGKIFPEHQSLIGLLKQHDYQSNSYYGGWGYYDNIGYYLDKHKIDYLITEDSFDNALFDRRRESFAWGYNDKALFKQSLMLAHNKEKHTPFLDVYQTLSIHTPYTSASKEYYSEKFIKNRLAKVGLQKSDVPKIPEIVLSSIFFTEDALKEFITTTSKRDEYKNTIFIITGDHGIDYPIGNKPLDKFNVPLIIYSDLLVQADSFKGLCSHIDVLPSLIALLSENYGMDFPNEKHWLGQGLDTSKVFKARNDIPLAIYDDLLPQYVTENYILYKNHILEFDKDFQTKEVEDASVTQKLRARLDNYIYINEYSCIKDKIWYANHDEPVNLP